MDCFFIPVVFLFGIISGSFLNVCIYRIPKKESFIKGRSHCTFCMIRLKPKDLIPVISYILLKGKCRYCQRKIPIKYPLIELLNGALYILCYIVIFKNGFSNAAVIEFVFLCILSSVLIIISLIDIEHQIIPNGSILFLLYLNLAYIILKIILNIDVNILDFIIGFFAASIPLLIIAVATKGGMGGGDIKLMAASGLFLGWKGVLAALFAGSVFGSLIGIMLMIKGKKKRKDMIPFGPFLAAGILFSALYGERLLDWYFNLM